ncbi:phosphoadenylyl-sulfate reductase [Peribacillus sp. B-H-3]|uniref:phosphoadenylyl-sulfate reductase n=1 Tax=Peribacillus sp. B-H-3 TaxID=3400420 RepID=UPI003B01EF73
MGNSILVYQNFDEHAPVDFPAGSETKGALEVLDWAYKTYADELVYACSFGIEGIVMIDLISKITDRAKIVFLDTGLHFEETYQLIERVSERYPNLQIEMKKPELTLEEQAEQYGAELWKREPDKCCELRKIIPLNEVLSMPLAWISGLRREQSPSRRNTQFFNKDNKFRSVKICPLIHWTWKDVWRYAHKNDLQYNILHDKGYPSIGCETCTAAAVNEDDLRSGRWSATGKTECGLHTS